MYFGYAIFIGSICRPTISSPAVCSIYVNGPGQHGHQALAIRDPSEWVGGQPSGADDVGWVGCFVGNGKSKGNRAGQPGPQ